MTLYEFLKSIILILVFATIIPFLLHNIKLQYNYFLEPYTYIAILPIKGSLSDSSVYSKNLRSFFKDPLIKGIVLKIDCFESAAGTSQIIFNEIQHYKKEYPKPVITLVENVCVAGGYLIASASDYIIAPETAIIGGIGRYTYAEQLTHFLSHFAVNYCIKKNSQEQNIHNNVLYNETYQHFIKQVATTRKLSLATVSNWANEKIFTGKQAYSLGLVNALGSMHTVISFLKEKALIDGEIEWIEKEHNKSNIFQSHLLQSIYSNIMKKSLKEA